MDKELKKKITDVAGIIWNYGSAGSGCINVRFMRKLSLEETKRIQEMFKPEIEKELAKLHAMKKNDLNRNYVMSFMRICTKLDGEDNSSEFTLENACNFKVVHGRQIHTILPVEEILKQDVVGSYRKKSSKDWHGHERFTALKLDEDGCYKRFKRDEIYQPGIEITRKNWGRAAMKSKFIQLVIDYVKQQEELGWKLVATEHEEYGSMKTRFDFERAA